MGDFFELFGLESVKSAFSQNRCAVNITTAVWPPSPGHERPMGKLRQAVAHLFFNGF
jgi:hypothetical protein